MKKIIAIALALMLLTSMSVTATAVADETVPTEAVVGGGLTPPYICAKFETPDHDDATPGTQISPVPNGERIVKFYVITGHPTDLSKITRVDVTVLNPDGTEKYQLVAAKDPTGIWVGTKHLPDGTTETVAARHVAYSDLIDMNGDCDTDDPEDLPVPDALDALDAESRITYGSDHNGNVFDLGDVKYDLETEKQMMIEIKGQMDYHQVAGMYRVEARSTDNQGATGTALANTFQYLSIVSLLIDFEKVNWGNIKSGETSIVYGNATMEPPASTRPTVQNVGNDPAKILLDYSEMINGDGKTITDFDGKLNGGSWTTCPVGVPTALMDATGTAPQVLPACTPTQIDFSIHPPPTTMGGTYTGSVAISIDHA
jgi:hypothetical protein